MYYTKVKNYNIKQLKGYLSQYKNIPWVFYDIETTGLNAEEKLKIGDKFWLTKPSQITQISAAAFKPSLIGHGIKEKIDWNVDWTKVKPAEIYYKNNLSDGSSTKGEFNEKCMLNKFTYNQLTLERLAQSYMTQFESTDVALARKIHYSIREAIKNDLESVEISAAAKIGLEEQLKKFDNLSAIFWRLPLKERRNMRKEFMSALSRLTGIILKGTKKSILDATSYFDDHYPDGTEEELLINFNSYLEDIKASCESDKVVLLGQNNSCFDHRFIDARMRKYCLKHNNNSEFDVRGVTKYLLHPYLVANKDTNSECKRIHESLWVEREDPKKSYLSARLGDVAVAFGVKSDKWHNAIYDVRMTKHIFFKIIRFLDNENL
jgi:DNA polymerase III epsilon subunit-like protein